MEAVEPRVMLTTYYVSPSGSDFALGTSQGTAWQTVEKINALNLDAGDQVLFQGGSTFSVPAGRTNVVGNPGFETGTFGAWNEDLNQSGNRSSITSTAANVHSGTYALQLDGNGGRGQDITTQLQPNRSYELKFWAKYTAGNGNTAYVGVTVSTATGNQTTYLQVPATGAYQQYTIGLAAPTPVLYADVWATNSQGTSVLYLDDVSVAESQVLRFDATDSGTAASPVMIGSYGTGRATLNAGTGSGLLAENVAGFDVRDLNFTGIWNGLAGTGTNGGSGVQVVNTLPGAVKINYIRLQNLDVSGFKSAGVVVLGQQQKSGFDDVRINAVVSHDNGDVGINVAGAFDQFSSGYAHTNVTVEWCKVYNIGGIADKGAHSGDGIVVADVNGAFIQRNLAYNNGQNNNYVSGGPVGIWTWDSNNVTIQYNESYLNKTGAASFGGGGFDLDGGVTNSIVQYNYAHDNMGPGFMLFQFAGARAYGNNTVRYNISQNDSRNHDHGAIYLSGGAGLVNNQVYGNTVYLTPSSNAGIAAIKLVDVGTGNTIRNNIFYTTSGVRPVATDAAYATSSVLFQGNDYFVASGAFQIAWGGATYASLAAWRTATSQEMNGAASTGSTANPMLINAGNGGTVGDAARLHTLTAYQFLPVSPVKDAGVNLTTLGVSVGARDYFGATPNYGTGYDIGAFEWRPTFDGSAFSDAFILRVGPGGLTELFANTPTSDAPTLAWTPAVYGSYTVAGNASDDTFTLDMTGGNPLPDGNATFDAGTGSADAIVLSGTAGNDIISVNSATIHPTFGTGTRTLGYGGVDGITLNTAGGNDNLKFNAATAPVTFNGGAGLDTLDINSGTFTFNTNAAAGTSDLTINVAAGAAAVFNASQQLNALNVTGSATVSVGGASTLSVKSLTLPGTGTLNLTDNQMTIDYTGSSPLGTYSNGAYTGVVGLIVSGSNGANWNGPGIRTSMPDALSLRTTLGVAEASEVLSIPAGQTRMWEGRTVDSTTVLIKYTYNGDANLDGQINADDYANIDLYSQFPASNTYAHGDFNYGGSINADDYALIDLMSGAQGNPL
jgi:hypothetical protein